MVEKKELDYSVTTVLDQLTEYDIQNNIALYQLSAEMENSISKKRNIIIQSNLQNIRFDKTNMPISLTEPITISGIALSAKHPKISIKFYNEYARLQIFDRYKEIAIYDITDDNIIIKILNINGVINISFVNIPCHTGVFAKNLYSLNIISRYINGPYDESVTSIGNITKADDLFHDPKPILRNIISHSWNINNTYDKLLKRCNTALVLNTHYNKILKLAKMFIYNDIMYKCDPDSFNETLTNSGSFSAEDISNLICNDKGTYRKIFDIEDIDKCHFYYEHDCVICNKRMYMNGMEIQNGIFKLLGHFKITYDKLNDTLMKYSPEYVTNEVKKIFPELNIHKIIMNYIEITFTDNYACSIKKKIIP